MASATTMYDYAKTNVLHVAPISRIIIIYSTLNPIYTIVLITTRHKHTQLTQMTFHKYNSEPGNLQMKLFTNENILFNSTN